MSESMVERVAKAVQTKLDYEFAERGGLAAEEMAVIAARAAIEAMRNHTAQMDAAGFDASPGSMLIKTGVDHLDIYRAMIDAALEEGK